MPASTANTSSASPVGAGSLLELHFSVQAARCAEYAAVPTLEFPIWIEAPVGQAIRSLLLEVQVQISARERGYDAGAQERLRELFGTPERWGSTLRTLPWTRATLVVPPFTGATSAVLPIHCSYDLEVSASSYLSALEDGEVPLEFLFSGTVFYAGELGQLQVERIGLDQEARYRMPVAVFRETMERHFPGAAWLRLGRASFDALRSYKARHAFESFDAAVEALLSASEPR